MIKRSSRYWREFNGHAELEAISVRTGNRVYKTGRGSHLLEMATKYLAADLWKGVRVRRRRAMAWIPIEDIKYVPVNDRLRGRT